MRFVKSFLVALVGSVIANLIILFVLGPVVNSPDMPLHALAVGPVAGLTIGGVIGATIVYALIRAFLSRPNKLFLYVSVVVLLLSFIPDIMIIGQTTGPFAGGTVGSALVLALMHVAAAAIIVWSLTRLWGPRMVAIVPVPGV